MHNFKELGIWQESKDFCVFIYKMTFDELIGKLNIIQKKLVNFNKYLKNK